MSGALTLDAVRRRCEAASRNLTEPRARVMEMLLAADGPAKAYELIARYAPGVGSTKPMTVYRALEFLERMGVVHKVVSLNAFVACRLPDELHEPGFLICQSCARVNEVAVLRSELVVQPRVEGFVDDKLIFEALGTCDACRPPGATSSMRGMRARRRWLEPLV